jgi:translocator protein
MVAKDYKKLIYSIIICQMAGVVGALFTSSSVSTWYAALTKPALTPPGWVFGPVWTVLYLLMGVALFLIWKKGIKSAISKIAVKVFAIQLALNVLWSILFFGMQKPGLAFIDIVILWLGIVASIYLFYKISKPAAYLLIPYLLWVSFATYLNYSFWI